MSTVPPENSAVLEFLNALPAGEKASLEARIVLEASHLWPVPTLFPLHLERTGSGLCLTIGNPVPPEGVDGPGFYQVDPPWSDAPAAAVELAQPLANLLEQLPIGQRVLFEGWIDSSQLKHVYTNPDLPQVRPVTIIKGDNGALAVWIHEASPEPVSPVSVARG